jgi:hypothetical protein
MCAVGARAPFEGVGGQRHEADLSSASSAEVKKGCTHCGCQVAMGTKLCTLVLNLSPT